VKIELDNIEYDVQPLPLELSYISALYAEKANQKAKSIEDGLTRGKELVEIRKLLLQDCVSPTPKPEHETLLHIAINKLTLAQNERVEQFFRDQKQHPEKGCPDGANSAP